MSLSMRTIVARHARLTRVGIAMVATAVVVTIAALGAAVPDARADAESCAFAPLGYTCNYTHGSGLHVDSVDVIRSKASWDGICSYSASVEVRGPDGAMLFNERTGVVRDGECVVGRAYITIPVNRDFPADSKLSTRFFEKDEQQGGAVFVGINP
ncbi:MAG: hypothetical protein QOD83_2717 [Solirubrobacteraceae bacterium]|jgi:hypothetical protein|nr:hypothetical protein [Solirubrobacteraceae bacterium]